MATENERRQAALDRNTQTMDDGLTGCQRWVANMYVDWISNYLTIERFSNDHRIPQDLAAFIIDCGYEYQIVRLSNAKTKKRNTEDT